MGWIVQNIDWVLIVSGLGTCSVVLMAIAPAVAQRSFFGEIAEGPVANLIARSWGVMVFAAGLMMIYAAYHPEARLPILIYAIVGKGSFVVLTAATPAFRMKTAGFLAVLDLIIIALLGWYLVAAPMV
jgi:hypothetical protein